jgi:hypothetical protein
MIYEMKLRKQDNSLFEKKWKEGAAETSQKLDA